MRKYDGRTGGLSARFPTTRRSAIVSTASSDPGESRRAFETVVAAYWKPAYKYIRIQWREDNEGAEDLTQGFFTKAIERGLFRNYDPEKASFRTYLRTCLDGFVANERKSAKRLKRGGGLQAVSLDFEGAENELRQHLVPDGISMEDYFQREWVRSLFALAVDRLRAECGARGRQTHFALFQRYDLEDDKTSYERLAKEFGIPVTQVTNHLSFARREFRRIVLDQLRDLTADEREFRREAQALLGNIPL